MVTQPTLTRLCILFLVWVAWGAALLLIGAAKGADDQAVNRKVKAALAIAEAEAKGRKDVAAASATAIAPPPRVVVPKDYATGHAESLADNRPLVVFVGCDPLKIEGAVVSKMDGDSFAGAKGPAVVVGFPQGDRLYVDAVIPCPAEPAKIEAAVRTAGKKIDQRPKMVLPPAPKPLDWQIRKDAPCVCGGDCKCAAGKCPGSCPLAVKAEPVLVGYQRVCNGNGTCRMVPVYR